VQRESTQLKSWIVEVLPKLCPNMLVFLQPTRPVGRVGTGRSAPMAWKSIVKRHRAEGLNVDMAQAGPTQRN